MLDTDDVVHAWNRAGNPMPHHRISLHAQALATLEGLGPDGGAR